jgi:hypothetical protein
MIDASPASCRADFRDKPGRVYFRNRGSFFDHSLFGEDHDFKVFTEELNRMLR